MTQFFYHKYTLNPVLNIGSVAKGFTRQGCLIKVQWSSKLYGYSDLFPWPELGDFDIETQMLAFKNGKISALVENSIYYAKLDAIARRDNLSLTKEAPKIKNHFLVAEPESLLSEKVDELKALSFSSLKLKFGADHKIATEVVKRLLRQNPWLMLRLDFNSKLDFQSFHKFATSLLPQERARIEYVEDPIPWDLAAWKEASEFLPLALDIEASKIDFQNLETIPFKVFVIKPLKLDIHTAEVFLEKNPQLQIVVTSNLGHAVDTAHSFAQAVALKKKWPQRVLDCGLLGGEVYQPNVFSQNLQIQGPYLLPLRGIGIGFNAELANINWTPIEKYK